MFFSILPYHGINYENDLEISSLSSNYIKIYNLKHIN